MRYLQFILALVFIHNLNLSAQELDKLNKKELREKITDLISINDSLKGLNTNLESQHKSLLVKLNSIENELMNKKDEFSVLLSQNEELNRNLNYVILQRDSLKNSLIFEVEKWKSELLYNGEVGPPCQDNYQQWTTENPNYYWGIQKLNTLSYDFNSDGNKDYLIYFPAVNCVGGNGMGSDFAMLVYSKNDNIFTNKNITSNIESKIKLKLVESGIFASEINLNFTTLTKTINGNYSAWIDVDSRCCPHYNGTFEYNPIDFSILVKNNLRK